MLCSCEAEQGSADDWGNTLTTVCLYQDPSKRIVLYECKRYGKNPYRQGEGVSATWVNRWRKHNDTDLTIYYSALYYNDSFQCNILIEALRGNKLLTHWAISWLSVQSFHFLPPCLLLTSTVFHLLLCVAVCTCRAVLLISPNVPVLGTNQTQSSALVHNKHLSYSLLFYSWMLNCVLGLVDSSISSYSWPICSSWKWLSFSSGRSAPNLVALPADCSTWLCRVFL